MRPFIQDIYARMSAINPTKFQLKYMDETILEVLSYLLDIHSTIEKQKAEKEKLDTIKRKVDEQKRRDFFYDQSK